MIAYAFPLRLRPAVNGAMGILTASATALGPPLGGVFITKASWRWCFAISPIIGAPTFIAAFFILCDLKFPEQIQEGFWSKVRRIGLALQFFFPESYVSCLRCSGEELALHGLTKGSLLYSYFPVCC